MPDVRAVHAPEGEAVERAFEVIRLGNRDQTHAAEASASLWNDRHTFVTTRVRPEVRNPSPSDNHVVEGISLRLSASTGSRPRPGPHRR